MPSDPDFPSAAEMSVIYWLSLIVAVAIGLGTLIWSFKVDAIDTAIALRVVGVISLVIAVPIFVGQKLVSFFWG